jgi:hypothetical protein
VPETARYDLCGAGCLAPKHALIAEKAEGHYAHLMSIPDGVYDRNRRRDDQSQGNEPRAEPAYARLGHHGEASFRYYHLNCPSG